MATLAGHSGGIYGQRFPTDTSRDLEVTGELQTVRLRLWKAATLDGFVFDDVGDPLIDVAAVALRETGTSGSQGYASAGSVRTDDRGHYRFSQLVPGRYLLAVPAAAVRTTLPSAVRGNRSDNFATAYFPGSPNAAGAAVLTLGSGEIRESVNLQERPPVGGRHVVGSVLNAPERKSVQLIPAGIGTTTEMDVRTVVTDASGHFEFGDVVPGQYVVRFTWFPVGASGGPGVTVHDGRVRQLSRQPIVWGRPLAPIPDGATLWSATELVVPVPDANDPVELSLVPRLGGRIRGKLVFDGAAVVPADSALNAIAVLVQPDSGEPLIGFQLGRIEADRTFETVGLPSGKYFLFFSSDVSGWSVKSILARGVEGLDAGVEVRAPDVTDVVITMADRVSKVSGSVSDPKQLGVADASVYVFPVDRSLWNSHDPRHLRIREDRPTKDGKYSFVGLPPGEYYIAAVVGNAEEAWRRPDFLARLVATSVKLKLTEGETRVEPLELRIGQHQH